MTSLGRLVTTVRNERTVAAALRRLSHDARPSRDRAPAVSASPSRSQLRRRRRLGVRAYRMDWHGTVPPIWQQLDGRHFDVLRLTRMRAGRARQAAALDARATLHTPETPCATGVTSRATTPDDADDAAQLRAARPRRTRRADAERMSRLHCATRALSRTATPAPPRAVLRAGRAVALTVP